MSCSNPLLYSPAPGRDAGDQTLTVFRPTHKPVDPEPDYSNMEVSIFLCPWRVWAFL